MKPVMRFCHLCKKYHRKPFHKPATMIVPVFHTRPSWDFENTGADFAGPFEFKISLGKFGKAYFALIICTASQAVSLDLLKNVEVNRRCLKEFYARRGNTKFTVGDKAKHISNYCKKAQILQQSADINKMLEKLWINWKFTLARNPWWRRFFELIVGLTKNVCTNHLGNRY